MSYPLKESYRQGQSISSVPARDLSTVAKTLNDVKVIGLRFKKTSSGLGWEIELQLDGVTLEFVGTTTTVRVKDGGVTEAKLASNAVTEAKIGTGAVTVGKIGTGAVTEAKLDSGAVTEAKIGTGAVTETKLGALSVSTGKLANNAVTSAKTTGASGTITVFNNLTFTNGLLTSYT